MTRFSNNEVITIDVHCHAETPKAMLLSIDGDEDNASWTPKSQMTGVDVSKGQDGVVEMKEWVAKKNGFV